METRKIPNSCTLCGKVLSSKQSLNQHNNTHTGEKTYICRFPGCGSKYKHASQLSNHKLIHYSSETDIRNLFGDMKLFVQLLLKMFENKEENLRISETPKEKFILPLITGPKCDQKLPLADSLSNNPKEPLDEFS